MLPMALALAAAATVLELVFVYKFEHLLERFRKSPLLGLGFSIALSLTLGEAFGAAGMIVLFAAVASTVATWLVYKTGLLAVVRRIGARLRQR